MEPDTERTELTVLLEYQGSRWELKICRGSILEDISKAVKKLADSDVTVAIGSDHVAGKGQVHLLQRWSNKWDTFVNVLNPLEVMGGDRVALTMKPGISTAACDTAHSTTVSIQAPEYKITYNIIYVCLIVEYTFVQNGSQALRILGKVKKPSPDTARALSTLFGSSSQHKRPQKDVFDPTDTCLAEPARKKKKAFRSKPSNITVVVLPQFVSYVPRGKKREQLKRDNRLKVLSFERRMTPKQVQEVIKKGFANLKLETWTYLDCSADGMLSKVESNDVDGEKVVSRKGSLYLCQSKVCDEDVSDYLTNWNLVQRTMY